MSLPIGAVFKIKRNKLYSKFYEVIEYNKENHLVGYEIFLIFKDDRWVWITDGNRGGTIIENHENLVEELHWRNKQRK